MNISAAYPEFEHEAHELTRYIEASGLFSILLKCGNIIHHTPAHADDFRDWLTSHNIINLRSDDGR